MEASPTQHDAASLAKAQRLRLGRLLRGTIAFGCTAAIVVSCWLFGYLDGSRVLHYLAAVVAINAVALALLLTNLNLRFRDPSMTVGLIFASLWPSIYVMYFVSEPMVRAAFLLMGTVSILFGALALDHRRMLALGGMVLLPYVCLVAALYYTAPERLDLKAEIVMVLTYSIVLTQIASLGSFIGGLRRKLRERNLELQELATRDPLTRLPNRRTAMLQLERELGRAERRQRDGDGLCIGLLDVDLFKRVNDRFGHQTGDEVLRQVGMALTESMRQGDFVARFGGEEFLLILPETSLAGGVRAAERLRTAVAGLKLDALPDDMPVTVSIGIAAHEADQRMEDTLGLADQALYQAKHAGRNRVVAWQPAVPSRAAGTS